MIIKGAAWDEEVKLTSYDGIQIACVDSKKVADIMEEIQEYNPNAFMYCNMDNLELFGIENSGDIGNLEPVVSVYVQKVFGHLMNQLKLITTKADLQLLVHKLKFNRLRKGNYE